MGASQSSTTKPKPESELRQENVMLKQSDIKTKQFRAKVQETKLIANTERLQKECGIKIKTLQAQKSKLSTNINKLNTEFDRANLQLNAIKRRTTEANKKNNVV